MSALIGPTNAIAYAQFNMQGRWKRLLSITGGYILLVGGAILLSNMGEDRYHRNNFEGWLGGLTGLQVLTLLLFGGFRVDSAVRGDVTSRMLESHRLMPTSPLAGIFGYICGAPLQAFLLGIANFLLGVLCCVESGMSLNQWALANAMLLCAALCIYAMLVQFAFIARGGFLLMLIASLIITVAGANEGLRVLPSLNVLTCPLLGGNNVFFKLFNGPFVGNVPVQFDYLCALAGQAAVAAICIRVALRRYQSASAIGISPVLGLLLLATWTGLAVADFFAPEGFNIRRFGYSEDIVAGQVVTSFSVAMLLASLPIASMAKSVAIAQQTRGAALTKVKTNYSVLFIALMACAIICFILISAPVTQLTTRVGVCLPTTALIVTLMICSLAAIFSSCYLIRLGPGSWVFAIIWVALTWVGPILIDVVYRGMTDSTRDASIFTAASPVGALALLWSNSDIPISSGIITQCSFGLVALGLLLLARKNRRRRDQLILPS